MDNTKCPNCFKDNCVRLSTVTETRIQKIEKCYLCSDCEHEFSIITNMSGQRDELKSGDKNGNY